MSCLSLAVLLPCRGQDASPLRAQLALFLSLLSLVLLVQLCLHALKRAWEAQAICRGMFRAVAAAQRQGLYHIEDVLTAST